MISAMRAEMRSARAAAEYGPTPAGIQIAGSSPTSTGAGAGFSASGSCATGAATLSLGVACLAKTAAGVTRPATISTSTSRAMRIMHLL
jgi:hypothetical protein